MTDRLKNVARIVRLIRDRDRAELARINAELKALQIARAGLARDPGLQSQDADPLTSALWYRAMDAKREQIDRDTQTLEARRKATLAELARAEGRTTALGALLTRRDREAARRSDLRADAERASRSAGLRTPGSDQPEIMDQVASRRSGAGDPS